METLYNELQEKLNAIIREEPRTLQQAQQCIAAAWQALSQLKQWMTDHPFADKQAEIHFFKETKPQFLCELLYYSSLFNIERRKPMGSVQVQKDYLHKELNKISEYFDSHQEFYDYYRMQATYLDELYFLRGVREIYLTLENFMYDADPQFSTGYDYKLARLLANDKLVGYLNHGIEALDSSGTAPTTKPALHWTLSKTACIELLYALHSVGAFGKIDLKQMANYFESAFHIDLKNYYHTFLEIRIRKTGRSTFLDLLREKLIQRMNEIDENIS